MTYQVTVLLQQWIKKSATRSQGEDINSVYRLLWNKCYSMSDERIILQFKIKHLQTSTDLSQYMIAAKDAIRIYMRKELPDSFDSKGKKFVRFRSLCQV